MYEGERFNSISHLAGAILSLCGLSLLVTLAAIDGDPWKIVSFSVYGATLLLLYTCSTLYHSVRGPAKALFRKLDHLSIYLLIAGTYTPFSLVALRDNWGWWLLGIIWFLAIVGMALELYPRIRNRVVSVVICLLMGWLILAAFKPLLEALPRAGVYWIVAGGVLYSVGVVFYALDKKALHFHGIWHLFVLAGSLSHFCAILIYLA